MDGSCIINIIVIIGIKNSWWYALISIGQVKNFPTASLIGLAAMAYEPLYHAREKATIKLSSGCSLRASFQFIIHLAHILLTRTCGIIIKYTILNINRTSLDI